MVYKDRLILFIDLLGFKAIVNRSVKDAGFLDSIYTLLQGITSEVISIETFSMVNKGIVPQQEMARVTDLNKKISQAIKMRSSLAVTHFSDSLVISAEVNDETSAFSIFELVAKLSYRLWDEYKILTRGGITIGKLIHEEGGVLIGPAMVRAYELESVLAVVPRVLIDEVCIDYIKTNPLYRAMTHLFKEVGPIANAEKGIELNKGLEINLATGYAHFLNSHYSFRQELRTIYLRTLHSAKAGLTAVHDGLKGSDVKSKYHYLMEEVELVSKQIPY